MSHYVFYNNNPKGKQVGDCTVRAISLATEQDWNKVYLDLCLQGYMLGIAVNGAVIPESVAIVTPAAVEDYWHINTEQVITVPACCCVSVSAVYADGTEDDPATTPTPSITVRRNASITIERTA